MILLTHLHEALNHAGVHGDGTTGAVAAAIGDRSGSTLEARRATAACKVRVWRIN